MTVKNSNTTHPERNQSAGKNADGLTLPPDAFASTDTFVNALADELAPEFRKIVDAMTDHQKREFEWTAIQVMEMDSEQRTRIAKYLADNSPAKTVEGDL
jgi:uncharacterized NAD(P)/FAD-binding protein YdhS